MDKYEIRKNKLSPVLMDKEDIHKFKLFARLQLQFLVASSYSVSSIITIYPISYEAVLIMLLQFSGVMF